MIKSLQIKKQRFETGLFVVEGQKSVQEVLRSKLEVKYIFGNSEQLKILDIPTKILSKTFELSSKDLQYISGLESNHTVLAVVEIPQHVSSPIEIPRFQNAIVLDGIQDPGNLGTIVRTADWFGISYIICSENTVDFYNPKVIQATMGSFTRLQPVYVNLENFLQQIQANGHSIYGLSLQGKSIELINPFNGGVLVFGNESHGLSTTINTLVTEHIHIPGKGRAESLNVAVAAGIAMSRLIG